MADKKYEVVITCNSQQPVAAVEAIKKELDRLKNTYKQLEAAGKANTAKGKETFAQIQELTGIYKANRSELGKIDKVTKSLADASLTQLKTALRAVKKELAKMSESNPELENMKEKFKAIKGQISLLEGETVNIKKGMKNLKEVSTSWLTTAIRQQREMVDGISYGTKEYQKQEKVLKALVEEESRRKASQRPYEASLQSARQMATSNSIATANGGTYAINQKDLEWSRDYLRKQIASTPVANTDEIKALSKDLELVEGKLNDVRSAGKEAGQTFEQMEGDIKKMVQNVNAFTPEQLRKGLNAVNTELDKTQLGSERYKELQHDAKTLSDALKGVSDEAVDVDKVMKNLKTTPLADLKKAAKQLETEISTLERGTQQYADKQKELKGLQAEIDNVTGAFKRQGGIVQNAIKNITAYVGVFGAFNAVKDKITEGISANFMYSDSLSDIRKVSGLTKEAINDLSNELAKVDTRTSLEEMSSIAYTGAKLGMGKYGISGLASFANASNQVNVALREDMGDDSLKYLSKMVEVMGLIPRMGVEKSLLATSSALFKLAATSTSSADQIVEFSKRLTGVARTAHITTPELLALGSASDSMMLMPEVSSTAFSKLITQMQKSPQAIEKALSIPEGTINKMYQANHFMDAIVLILEKMKKTGNMNALGDVFKDLGSDGTRLVSVLVTMAQNVDMLKSHLYESNQAFEEATAVTDEYNIQQETAQAYMERARNLFTKAFVGPEQISMVQMFAKAWYDTAKIMTETSAPMAGLKLALWGIAYSLTLLIRLIPTIAVALLNAGIFYALNALTSSTSTLTLRVNRLKVAWQGLSNVMKVAGIVGVITTVASLAYQIYEWVKASDSAAESQKKLNDYLVEGAAKASEETRKLDEYIRVAKSANISTKARQDLIAKFNNEYSTYLNKLGLEVNSVEDLTKVYEKLNEEIRKKTFYEMREQAYSDQLKPLQKESHDSGVKLDQTFDKLGTGAINRKYINELLRQISQGQVFGIKYGDVNAIGNYAYHQVMENMYGKYYNRKREAVDFKFGKPIKGEKAEEYEPYYVSKMNGVSFSNLRSQIYGYVNDRMKEVWKKDEIDKAFEIELADYDNVGVKILGNLNKNNTKHTGGGGTRSTRDPNIQARDIAKSRANAILANINSFYEEQMKKYLEWVAEMNKEGERVSEGQQQAKMSELEQHRETARGMARKSIATGTELDNFKAQLRGDIFQTATKTDTDLLSSIEKSSIEDLHRLFTKLSGDLSKETHKSLSENLGSLLDEIFHKGTTDLLDAQKRLVERQRDLQAFLAEQNYTGTVDRSLRGGLDQFNLLPASPQIDPNTQEGVNQMATAFDNLTKKVRDNEYALWQMNLTTEEGEKAFRAFLSDPEIKSGFDFQKMNILELEALWMKLVKYPANYQAAEKEGDDRKKKLYDDAWKKTPFYNDNQNLQNQLEQQMKVMNLGSGLGLATPDMEKDTEIMLFKAKLAAAKEYYEHVKKSNATDAQLAEANRALLDSQMQLTEKYIEASKTKLDTLKKFMAPIEEYGTALGTALVDESKSVKEATGEMITSFVKLTGEYVNQKLTQWLMTKLYNSLMAESDNALLSTQQTNDALSAQSSVNSASVKVPAGIAAGAAETIAKLGWWGIPLVAGITAVLNGLMAMATSALSSVFGSKNGNTVKTDRKLVSGMLTYDEGNVQQYVGTDGKVYSATAVSSLPSDTRIMRSPVATTVNGSPALVAERGPEIILGRVTTSHLMHDAPQLISAMAQYDRTRNPAMLMQAFSGAGGRRKNYDEGNISDFATGMQTVQTIGDNSMQQSLDKMNAFLDLLIKEGVHMSMFGRNGAVSKLDRAQAFMRKHS